LEDRTQRKHELFGNYKVLMVTKQRLIVLTSTSDAIEFLTFSFISFHLFTPISGALFLVNITTSSTNERVFGPMGPPSLAENSICSFWEPPFILLWAADNPFRVPRPTFLGP
jgi:hypothetical protein